MKWLRYTSLNAADASMNQSGSAIDATLMVYASAQAIISGTAAGTLKLQGSNDAPAGPQYLTTSAPIHWSDLASVSISGAGVYLIPKTDICYEWVRVIYVSASGTGTITANVKTVHV
jgi:hypothetical protein